MKRLYYITNPEKRNCYDKLITQIRIVPFARDQNERIELLLKDFTLDDRSPKTAFDFHRWQKRSQKNN